MQSPTLLDIYNLLIKQQITLDTHTEILKEHSKILLNHTKTLAKHKDLFRIQNKRLTSLDNITQELLFKVKNIETKLQELDKRTQRLPDLFNAID